MNDLNLLIFKPSQFTVDSNICTILLYDVLKKSNSFTDNASTTVKST